MEWWNNIDWPNTFGILCGWIVCGWITYAMNIRELTTELCRKEYNRWYSVYKPIPRVVVMVLGPVGLLLCVLSAVGSV